LNQRKHEKVFTVRSLEEARDILFSADPPGIKTLISTLFIKTWVFGANCVLRISKYILFKEWRYSTEEFSNIVIYTVGIVGDNVVMLPALAAIRRRYPEATITVITNCQIWDPQGAVSILKPSPYKDRLIVLNDHPVQRRGLHLQMDKTKFEGIGCDLFVNLSPFGNRGWIGAVFREMFFARMLGAKYAVGFRMSTYNRGGILNRVQYRFVKNEPRRSREVLRELGLKPVENEDLLFCDPLAKRSILEKVKQSSNNHQPLFVINPGAKFESQCWPAKRFGNIASRLANHYDIIIVITGIAKEKHIAEEVVKSSGDTAVNLVGETNLQELIELLRIAKGCVTNDTGTMHLAAMIGVPTVAIFSTRHSPTHWLPVGENVVSVFCIVDCIYCYNDFCDKLDCLNRIEVNDVFRALKEFLDSP
jgi:heptosyltransferase-2